MYEIPEFISDALHGIPYFYQTLIKPQETLSWLTGVLLYQNMIFDSCFRLLPNGDGRGNDVIVIKSPACKLQVGL